MSENPAYPDADPTAPGGMSRKALVKELITVHGYERGTAAEWNEVPWPTLIQCVVEGRLEQDEIKYGTVEERTAAVAAEPEEIEEEEEIEEPVLEDSDMAEGDDPNPNVFKSAHSMFDALDDETEDEDEDEPAYEDTEGDFDTSPQIDEMFEALDDEPEPDQALTEAEAGFDIFDAGVLDPEVLFEEMEQARAEAMPAPMFIGLPVVKDYIFDGHAGAGPSGAERWMNCTMSLTASRKFLETLTPNQQAAFARSSTAARQGTTAHAVGETKANLLLGRIDQTEADANLLELMIMPDEEDEAYDEEMEEYVSEYTDLVKTYATERGGDAIRIEKRVEAAIPLTGVHSGEVYVVRGSADFTVVPDENHPVLVVGDLKYGEGKDVDVDENPQIRLYALGVLETLVDDEGTLPTWLDEVVYHIIQPRLGGIKTWTETVADLLAWRDEVLAPALTRALYGADEGATFSPSELACQWCPARGGCPALAEQRVADAAELFSAITDAEVENGLGAFPETSLLDNERLGSLLAQITGLEKLRKDLKEEAQRRLHRGVEVPGFQLVNYTPPRQWKEGADKALAKVPEVWKPQPMTTPTQALAALKENKAALDKVSKHIIAPDKRPVIGPVGDRRKAWEGKPPEQMFADETGED